ncbi:MAG: hypothetical protein ABR608_13535 [Pseudonocardiaceae bacterium]
MAIIENGRVPAREARRAAAPQERLFASLPEQLANIRQWNEERRWGLRAHDFHSVDLTPRAGKGRLVVDVIVVYLDEVKGAELDGVRRTCHELWTVAAEQQPDVWSWDWYDDRWEQRPKPVCLTGSIVHRPGIRRVTVDLGAHFTPGRHTRPSRLRSPASAHAEVLAAAAHFPRWIRAMDGTTIPYAWITGYQMLVRGRPTPSRLPALSWSHHRRAMNLTAGWAEHAYSGWAAPVCVG